MTFSPLVMRQWLALFTAICGAIGGLYVFFRGVYEYVLKNRLTRFQQFIVQRKEFDTALRSAASAVAPSSLPRKCARALDHRQSCARSTNRARTGLSET